MYTINELTTIIGNCTNVCELLRFAHVVRSELNLSGLKVIIVDSLINSRKLEVINN